MLRKLILSAALAGTLGVAAMPADARGYVSVGIGLPVPVVVAPPIYPGVAYGPGYYYGPRYYGPRFWGPPIAFGPRWHHGPGFGPGWHHGWR
jgi:hypothetical protein